MPERTEGKRENESHSSLGVSSPTEFLMREQGWWAWGRKIRNWIVHKQVVLCLSLEHPNGSVKKAGENPALRSRREIRQKQSIWELAI